MRVAVAQYPVAQEPTAQDPVDATARDPLTAESAAAREAIEQAAADGAGLVVLPEPAAPARGVPQTWDGHVFEAVLGEAAARGRITVVAGLWERPASATGPAGGGPAEALAAGNLAYSAVTVVGPDGRTVARYDKLHLYDAFSARESDSYLPGQQAPPVVGIPGSRLRLGVMTCYDLRFPEVARDLAVRGAHVIAVPAAWAAGPLKEEHWSVLLRARALENTAYLAAAGRTPPGHIGRSAVVDPLGVVLAEAGEEPAQASAHLSWQRLEAVRSRLPVLDQRRYADPVLR